MFHSRFAVTELTQSHMTSQLLGQLPEQNPKWNPVLRACQNSESKMDVKCHCRLRQTHFLSALHEDLSRLHELTERWLGQVAVCSVAVCCSLRPLKYMEAVCITMYLDLDPHTDFLHSTRDFTRCGRQDNCIHTRFPIGTGPESHMHIARMVVFFVPDAPNAPESNSEEESPKSPVHFLLARFLGLPAAESDLTM